MYSRVSGGRLMVMCAGKIICIFGLIYAELSRTLVGRVASNLELESRHAFQFHIPTTDPPLLSLRLRFVMKLAQTHDHPIQPCSLLSSQIAGPT